MPILFSARAANARYHRLVRYRWSAPRKKLLICTVFINDEGQSRWLKGRLTSSGMRNSKYILVRDPALEKKLYFASHYLMKSRFSQSETQW